MFLNGCPFTQGDAKLIGCLLQITGSHVENNGDTQTHFTKNLELGFWNHSVFLVIFSQQ